MAEIKASDVQKLRETTGAGVMDCKRALDETGGDFAEALELIKKRGAAIAEKKSGREAKAGLIEAYVHNNRIGVLLEIHAETDFVARSEPFKELAHLIVTHIAAMNPATVDELLKHPHVRNEKETINDLLTATIAKVGENIKVERFTRYEI